MEHTALFEERVALTPRDLRGQITSIDSMVLLKLATRLENKCSRHGFVIPDTLKIVSRSMGYIEKGRFTGDVVFHLQAEGTVLNPPAGIMIEGVVIRKNKMGMYVSYKDAIRIILPRDLHIGDDAFEAVKIGETVKVEIQKSRFQVNDPYVLSVGLFRGLVGELPIAEVEEEEEEVEAAPVQEEVEEEKKEEEAEEEEVPDELVILNNNNATVGGGSIIEFYSKKPEFREFSNFYAAPFSLDGKTWPSAEHYFQAMKFPTDAPYQEEIRQARTPAAAKTLGASRTHTIRPDWDTHRDAVMREAIKAKFTQNDVLKKLLLSTKGKDLVEANPTDNYWGTGRGKKGQNKMGKLLMELRSTLVNTSA